jgi:anti-sigma factor RsiW
MNCNETKELIHGYLDGEVDLVRSIAIEQHLKDCPACRAAYRQKESLRTTIARGSLYFSAPKSLEKRVRLAVRQASKADGRTEVPRGRWTWTWTWPTIISPLAAAALLLLMALPILTRHSAEDQLTQQIVNAHLRSLTPDTSHLADVPSSDQHTVKPWFAGKIDFSPPVTDLASKGFPLVGGRLDYIGEHPVAALAYQRRKHLINLFIWPEKTGSSRELQTPLGYNVIHANREGMTYWAISDVNIADLREFLKLAEGDSLSK